MAPRLPSVLRELLHTLFKIRAFAGMHVSLCAISDCHAITEHGPMSKTLHCPSCKNTISIDDATLATSNSIECQSCGSSFQLTKRTSQRVVSKPIPAEELSDAVVAETAGSQSAGLAIWGR